MQTSYKYNISRKKNKEHEGEEKRKVDNKMIK